MDTNNYNFNKRFDWPLTTILLIFLGVSVLAIASAQTSGQYGINFIPKQILNYAIFAFIVAFVMYFDHDQYKKMAWPLYGFGILLLIALVIIPTSTGLTVETNGAKSWYKTPIGNIQPAEFMKTFYILASAFLISKHNETYQIKTIKSDLMLLGKIALTLGVPLGFIMLQRLRFCASILCHYRCTCNCGRCNVENYFTAVRRGCRYRRFVIMDGTVYAGFSGKDIWFPAISVRSYLFMAWSLLVCNIRWLPLNYFTKCNWIGWGFR